MVNIFGGVFQPGILKFYLKYVRNKLFASEKFNVQMDLLNIFRSKLSSYLETNFEISAYSRIVTDNPVHRYIQNNVASISSAKGYRGIIFDVFALRLCF